MNLQKGKPPTATFDTMLCTAKSDIGLPHLIETKPAICIYIIYYGQGKWYFPQDYEQRLWER